MAFDFSEFKSKCEQVMKLASDDLNTIRTGRAKPSMVEDIMVEAYGSRMAV
jgi:ribosome recycling factor